MKIIAVFLLYFLGVLSFTGCAAGAVSASPVNPGIVAANGGSAPDFDETPAAKMADALLAEKGTLVADQKPLQDLLRAIADGSHVAIIANWKALAAGGITKDTPVSVEVRDAPWKRIINTVLAEAGAGTVNIAFTVEDDGTVTVSTKDDLDSAKYQEVRVFDIGLILDTVDPSERTDLIPVLSGGVMVTNFNEPSSMTAEIIDAVRSNIAPDTWKDNGGNVGSLRQVKGMLIVSQARDNLRAVGALIADLRAKAETRLRVYDVRDLVGDDDNKLHNLMDMMQGLSARRMWVERGGRMATMRGMSGHIYVEGAAHVQEEVEMQLRVIRQSHPQIGRMDLVTPTLSPTPPPAPAPPPPALPPPPPASRPAGG